MDRESLTVALAILEQEVASSLAKIQKQIAAQSKSHGDDADKLAGEINQLRSRIYTATELIRET